MDKLKFFLNIFGFTEVIDGGSFSRPTFLSPFKKYNTFRALQNGKRYKNCKHYKLYYHSAFCQVIFTYYTQFPKILTDFVYRSGGTFTSAQKHIYAKQTFSVRFFG